VVNKFSLIRTPMILFGRERAEELPGLLKNRGRNILIITGSKSYMLYPGIGKTLLALEKSVHSLHFDKIEKEPSPDDIDRIVSRYKQHALDAVVAIGGGSVVDTGKAVSAMLPLEGSVRNYIEGVGTRTHPGLKKYFIAIPTTSGTGSEATSNAVLSETGINGYKRSLRHENLVPDLALIDPVLMISCPPEVTAASGLDAFTQLIESYLSVKSNPLTDALALEGISKVHHCLITAVTTGDDIDARSGMAYAALLSGITLANAGLGLIHGYASSVGGLINVPHGVICGTMMGVVNRYNIRALLKESGVSGTHLKYGLLGKLFSGSDGKKVQWYMQYAADYIDNLTEELKMKRLGGFGISEADLGSIAEKTDHKANPVKFEKQELIEMLRERL
jgi:alcohol dehydrogenase class IV